MLEAIPLAERFPVSPRVGQRYVHPDRDDVVGSLEFSLDGSKLVGGTYPKNNLQIWDIGTGKQLTLIDTPDGYKSTSDFWSPSLDFSRFYTWHEGRPVVERLEVNGEPAVKKQYPDSRIQVWSSEDGRLLEEFQESPPNWIRLAQLSPGGDDLVTWEIPAGIWTAREPFVQRAFNLRDRQWRSLPGTWGPVTFADNSRKLATFASVDDNPDYADSIVIADFPGCDELRRIELPEGVHSIDGDPRFDETGSLLVAGFRTYERKNVWNKWQTTLASFDVETGEAIAAWRFPFDNDSPLPARQFTGRGTWMMVTLRNEMKKLIALKTPEMTIEWETDLGDFDYAERPVVAPDDRFVAVICTPGKLQHFPGKPIDWNLATQPILMLFDCQSGALIEKAYLPVGSNRLTFSPDGQSAVFASVGGAYSIDLADLLAESGRFPNLP